VQTLAALELDRQEGNDRPSLLVCPTSLMYNWQREAGKFTPELGVMLHHGPGRKRGDEFRQEAAERQVVVTSYGTMLRDAETLQGVPWRGGSLDGALHAIAFAPGDALGGKFLTTPVESASLAFTTSAFSYKTLAVGLLPLFEEAGGGSLVTLDFDNSTQAWPAYDWMGVCKAALASVTRYLARDLGRYNVRVNAVSAGPLSTMAAKGIPGFDRFQDVWNERAPLAWDTADPTPVANMICVMLSDFATKVTGEVIHVDAGFHAIAT